MGCGESFDASSRRTRDPAVMTNRTIASSCVIVLRLRLSSQSWGRTKVTSCSRDEFACFLFRLRHEKSARENTFDIAEELVDERTGGMFVDFVRRADLLDIPLMHHHDTIGRFERFPPGHASRECR